MKVNKQIITILLVLIAIIGLSGMTAAKSSADKKKCENEKSNILDGTITIIGSGTHDNNHPGDGDCKDKDKDKDKNKYKDKKHSKKHHK